MSVKMRVAGSILGAMAKFVLFPGACHGGWWYDPLVDRLRGEGHTALAVTPVGLEDDPRLEAAINLDTHIEQTVKIIAGVGTGATGAHRGIVLVGHSYGGSVITGVADRMPEQVRALVYLDAFIPVDGESCWQQTNDEQRDWYISGAAGTGLGVEPLPFFEDRARPHPLATLVQASRLTGAWREVPTILHVEATDWPAESPMAGAAARARSDPTITTYQWDTPHNVMRDGPDRVYDLVHTL